MNNNKNKLRDCSVVYSDLSVLSNLNLNDLSDLVVITGVQFAHEGVIHTVCLTTSTVFMSNLSDLSNLCDLCDLGDVSDLSNLVVFTGVHL